MMPVLDGCENPHGCRKIATSKVRIVALDTGETEIASLCAYCKGRLEEMSDVTVQELEQHPQ